MPWQSIRYAIPDDHYPMDSPTMVHLVCLFSTEQNRLVIVFHSIDLPKCTSHLHLLAEISYHHRLRAPISRNDDVRQHQIWLHRNIPTRLIHMPIHSKWSFRWRPQFVERIRWHASIHQAEGSGIQNERCWNFCALCKDDNFVQDVNEINRLTFNAFMSLWNSFSQNRGSDSKMEFSVTVEPYFLSNQSESASFDCSKKPARAVSIVLASPDFTAAVSAVLASVILKKMWNIISVFGTIVDKILYQSKDLILTTIDDPFQFTQVVYWNSKRLLFCEKKT